MKFTNVLALIAGAATSTAALAGDISRDEVRSIVAEALADAQTRSSLLQGGGAAGYDKGFYIASPNGDWKLNINGAIQFRYMIDWRDDNDVAAAPTLFNLNPDDFSNGFQMRRAYLRFSGNMVNPNLEYNLRLITDGTGSTSFSEVGAPPGPPPAVGFRSGSSGSNVQWDDLYMRYNFGNGWHVKAGQFRGAWLKENSNSDITTMAVERGIMHHAFNPGYTQGLSFDYEQDQWRFVVEATDGFNAQGSDFTDAPLGAVGFGGRASGESEYAFTGRLEYLVSGKWDALKDYTSKPGDASSWYLGGAVHYEQSTDLPNTLVTNRTDWFGATVDTQWEGNGWGLFGAIAFANADPSLAGANNTTDWGVAAQISYRWDEAPEIFVRWDAIFADTVRNFRDDDCHFITFGYNNYFAGNACKLSVDCVISISATDNPPAGVPNGLATTSFTPGFSYPGVLVNTGATPTLNAATGLQGQGKSGEFAIRAQWQVAF